jgi:glycerol-3-phosphate cytidylyltransferase
MCTSDFSSFDNLNKICFDLDNTLCLTNAAKDYSKSIPIAKAISFVNNLYEKGKHITIFTARGASSGIDWTELTINQLSNWGLKYHKLVMNKKPSYDIFFDDKAYNTKLLFDLIKNKTGIYAGSFDLMHYGYFKAFKEARNFCSRLVVFLHKDPSIERSNKRTPIFSVKEREENLKSIRYVDDVVIYESEKELLDAISSSKYDILFLGDDYRDKAFTGAGVEIEKIFLSRDHGWSSTKLINLIKENNYGNI